MARSSRGYQPSGGNGRNTANTFSVTLSDQLAAKLEQYSFNEQKRIPDCLRDAITELTKDVVAQPQVTAADGGPSNNPTPSVDDPSGKVGGVDPMTGDPVPPASAHKGK